MPLNLSLLTLLFLVSVTLSADKLTLESIYSDAGLIGPQLRSAKFSPDSKLITFLKSRPDDAKRYDLWAYDVASGKQSRLVNADDLHSGDEELSDEEKARRERQRLFATGIVSYEWSETGTALLFPLAGDLYYYDMDKEEARQIIQTETFELDAKFSKDGKKVAFIRDQDIFVLDLESGKEKALTFDGDGTIKNGMAEFVAQEEMGRLTGYWWGPESKQIAFLQVDESGVKEVLRNEIYADRIKVVSQRYPATGETNASLKLGVVSINDGDIRWLDTGEETDFYIPYVNWSKKADLLTYQWQSRNQQLLELRGVNPRNGQSTILARETSSTWINLHKDLRFLKKNNSLIWASERTGFKHLYLINGDKTIALTTGNWQVNSLAKVDEDNGWVYFTGWVKNPTERHLYRVNLDGSTAASPEQVSQRPGWHGITFSKDSRHYFDSYSNVNQPNQVSLHLADGKHITWLLENRLDETHPLFPYLENWIDPIFGTLKAEDGTYLYTMLFKPATPETEGRYPVIVYVYGGPIVGQQVRNAWSGINLWAQYMVSRGYAIFKLDNRGTYNRGKAFEDVLYKQFGQIELQDQVTGANWLKSQPWVDEDRIGIYGHSYGGYMTLMALFRAGDTYAAGVAGSPVTGYRLYDTHYTERYLSTPQANPDGYDASAVFPYTEGLKGDLLIYHGMADDNVLFSNTTKLIKQLQDQGKVFQFMAYPGAKHSLFGKETQIHRGKTIDQFFDRTIGK